MKPHYFLALPLTLALAACNDSGSSSSSSPSELQNGQHERDSRQFIVDDC